MEVGYILLVAVLLLLRTYYDIWVIKNTTSIERSVHKNMIVSRLTHDIV